MSKDELERMSAEKITDISEEWRRGCGAGKELAFKAVWEVMSNPYDGRLITHPVLMELALWLRNFDVLRGVAPAVDAVFENPATAIEKERRRNA